MEAQVVQLVSKLPPNQRVLATIEPFPGSRILNQHIIDRACIGRCFSYGNYEPGSCVFRVRATPGNPYVLDSYELATETEEGDYLVQPARSADLRGLSVQREWNRDLHALAEGRRVQRQSTRRVN